jgi:hypothetical protein
MVLVPTRVDIEAASTLQVVSYASTRGAEYHRERT